MPSHRRVGNGSLTDKERQIQRNPQKIFDTLAGYFGVNECTYSTYIYNVIANRQREGGRAVAFRNSLQTQEKSVNKLWLSIANKLSDGTVLIFDEAQHLMTKAIEILRSLYDYFNDKCQTLGICFIGNLETVTRMGGKKAEFAQIANRTKQLFKCL